MLQNKTLNTTPPCVFFFFLNEKLVHDGELGGWKMYCKLVFGLGHYKASPVYLPIVPNGELVFGIWEYSFLCMVV